MNNSKSILIILLLFISVDFFSQVQVDKFSGDASYGLPLITVPNFRGPSISTSISYRSDIKVDQPASEVGLGWNINAGGSVERSVNGVPDDWAGVNVPEPQGASFQNHLGALHLNKPNTNSTILDFTYSKYKIDDDNDSIRYHYPNYDTYYVRGAGMSGKLIPENYDYAKVGIEDTKLKRWFYNTWTWIDPDDVLHTEPRKDSAELEVAEIETYALSNGSPEFNYKTNFRFEYDSYDEVDSEYYPWSSSPLNASSSLPIPGESTNPTFNGSGYNDENYPIAANTNRAKSSNYIEYFTNAEIVAGGIDFMKYDVSFDRSIEVEFPQDGIGAYRITNANGYTYHYSLPVYDHYSTIGSSSLDKDDNVVIAEGGTLENTDNANGHVLENEYTHEVLEVKQIKKYAVRWLLTAITGPDYDDSDGNGMVDLADAGYWVKYDYGLWTETFQERFPYVGSAYSFSSSKEDEKSIKFRKDDDVGKLTGKMVSYTETEGQKYYLNEIQTPSHTGIFIRDLRNDEQSAIFGVDKSQYRSTKNLLNVTDIDCWAGEGRFATYANPTNITAVKTLTINPDGVDALKLHFETIHSSNFDKVKIYDGVGTSGTLLFALTYPGDPTHSFVPLILPGSGGNIGYYDVIANSGAITIVSDINYQSTWEVYDISWESVWNNALPGWSNGRALNVPQLKLSKMLLFENEDWANLPTTNAIYRENYDDLWDYSELNRTQIYADQWYDENETFINSIALQSIDLKQDYSLARGYHNNRHVQIDVQQKSATQVEVEANKYSESGNANQSGKLTLNKVVYYGLNRTQSQPSHMFDYDVNNPISNPDYNPLLQDYWGNYKSDAEGNLLKGYVTNASATGVSAWSLRKVTSPLGGVTEIIYESDEYEQVLSEDNGGNMRGAIKIFALKNAVPEASNVGGDWFFDFENQENEFNYLQSNKPSGTGVYSVVPGVWTNPNAGIGEDYYCYPFFSDIQSYPFNSSGGVISAGSGTITNNPNMIAGLTYHEIDGYGHLGNPPTSSPVASSECNTSSMNTLVYAGGGFVSFEYPLGYKVKGGGTRVKEVRVTNGSDTYTVAYGYNKGTATSEKGDFSKRKTEIDSDGEGIQHDLFLTSYDYNPFGLRPQVGYGEVTVENKGQVTKGEGKSIFSYNVSDENRNYFNTYFLRKTEEWSDPNTCCGQLGCKDVKSERLAIEIVDDFTTIWGKPQEEKLEDLNGNMVSKKVYEYETSTKGAHVQTVDYEIDIQYNNCDVYEKNLVCIFRTYPNYLNKVITYSNGRKSEMEILERDPFTGSPTITKSTDVNGYESKDELLLAYTQTTPNYSVFGAKSVDPSYHNFLNSSYSSKGYRTPQGVTTDDISSFSKSFWKESARVRNYNTLISAFNNTNQTVSWIDYVKYVYAGPLGDYGLFDNTHVNDITAPVAPNNPKWRMTSEITLMDEEQNVLEQKNFKDRFSASKLGYDNRFTYTSASNSNYVSFTASGFETETLVDAGVNYYEGEVLAQSGNLQIDSDVDGSTTIVPHTGNYMVKMPGGNNAGPVYSVTYDATEDIYSLQRGRTYSASVWVHANSPNDTRLVAQLTGNTTDLVTMTKGQSTIQIGDWIQLNVDIVVPATYAPVNGVGDLQITIDKTTSSNAWIDDLQFHSRVTGSGMNVYDQRTGRVMATLSDNNFATKYVYNDAGQVIEVWKEVLGEGWVKVESRTFNFKRAME